MGKGKPSVQDAALTELVARAQNPDSEDESLRHQVAVRGRGATLDLRRPTEGTLLARPRLANREEDTAQVHGNQQQIEGEHAENIGRPIATQSEVASVEGEVWECGERDPGSSPAIVEGQGQQQEQARVDHGEGGEIVAPHETFPERVEDTRSA